MYFGVFKIRVEVLQCRTRVIRISEDISDFFLLLFCFVGLWWDSDEFYSSVFFWSNERASVKVYICIIFQSLFVRTHHFLVGNEYEYILTVKSKIQCKGVLQINSIFEFELTEMSKWWTKWMWSILQLTFKNLIWWVDRYFVVFTAKRICKGEPNSFIRGIKFMSPSDFKASIIVFLRFSWNEINKMWR